MLQQVRDIRLTSITITNSRGGAQARIYRKFAPARFFVQATSRVCHHTIAIRAGVPASATRSAPCRPCIPMPSLRRLTPYLLRLPNRITIPHSDCHNRQWSCQRFTSMPLRPRSRTHPHHTNSTSLLQTQPRACLPMPYSNRTPTLRSTAISSNWWTPRRRYRVSLPLSSSSTAYRPRTTLSPPLRQITSNPRKLQLSSRWAVHPALLTSTAFSECYTELGKRKACHPRAIIPNRSRNNMHTELATTPAERLRRAPHV